jgi:hypothetical protein
MPHPRLSIPRSSNQQEWQSMHHAYLQYLNRIGLRESEMHELNRILLRQTFMSGASSMMGVMLEVFGYNEEEQADVIGRLIAEADEYWGCK